MCACFMVEYPSFYNLFIYYSNIDVLRIEYIFTTIQFYNLHSRLIQGRNPSKQLNYTN